MEFSINESDLRGLQNAVRRNPSMVLSETKRFLTQGLAAYNRGIIRNPWRVGMAGGGSPVDTGNMRDTHRKIISTWEARISPTTDYSEAVHRGRPWLDFVKQEKESEINNFQIQLLERITNDLTK